MHTRVSEHPIMERQLEVFARDSLAHSSEPSGSMSQVTSVLSESESSVLVLRYQFNTNMYYFIRLTT